MDGLTSPSQSVYLSVCLINPTYHSQDIILDEEAGRGEQISGLCPLERDRLNKAQTIFSCFEGKVWFSCLQDPAEARKQRPVQARSTPGQQGALHGRSLGC